MDNDLLSTLRQLQSAGKTTDEALWIVVEQYGCRKCPRDRFCNDCVASYQTIYASHTNLQQMNNILTGQLAGINGAPRKRILSYIPSLRKEECERLLREDPLNPVTNWIIRLYPNDLADFIIRTQMLQNPPVEFGLIFQVAFHNFHFPNDPVQYIHMAYRKHDNQTVENSFVFKEKTAKKFIHLLQTEVRVKGKSHNQHYAILYFDLGNNVIQYADSVHKFAYKDWEIERMAQELRMTGYKIEHLPRERIEHQVKENSCGIHSIANAHMFLKYGRNFPKVHVKAYEIREQLGHFIRDVLIEKGEELSKETIFAEGLSYEKDYYDPESGDENDIEDEVPVPVERDSIRKILQKMKYGDEEHDSTDSNAATPSLPSRPSSSSNSRSSEERSGQNLVPSGKIVGTVARCEPDNLTDPDPFFFDPNESRPIFTGEKQAAELRTLLAEVNEGPLLTKAFFDTNESEDQLDNPDFGYNINGDLSRNNQKAEQKKPPAHRRKNAKITDRRKQDPSIKQIEPEVITISDDELPEQHAINRRSMKTGHQTVEVITLSDDETFSSVSSVILDGLDVDPIQSVEDTPGNGFNTVQQPTSTHLHSNTTFEFGTASEPIRTENTQMSNNRETVEEAFVKGSLSNMVLDQNKNDNHDGVLLLQNERIEDLRIDGIVGPEKVSDAPTAIFPGLKQHGDVLETIDNQKNYEINDSDDSEGVDQMNQVLGLETDVCSIPEASSTFSLLSHVASETQLLMDRSNKMPQPPVDPAFSPDMCSTSPTVPLQPASPCSLVEDMPQNSELLLAPASGSENLQFSPGMSCHAEIRRSNEVPQLPPTPHTVIADRPSISLNIINPPLSPYPYDSPQAPAPPNNPQASSTSPPANRPALETEDLMDHSKKMPHPPVTSDLSPDLGSISLTVPVQPSFPRSSVKDMPQNSDILPAPVNCSENSQFSPGMSCPAEIRSSNEVPQLPPASHTLSPDRFSIPLTTIISPLSPSSYDSPQAPALPNNPQASSTSPPANRPALETEDLVDHWKKMPHPPVTPALSPDLGSISFPVPVQPASPRSSVQDVPQDSDQAPPIRSMASSANLSVKHRKVQQQVHRSEEVPQQTVIPAPLHDLVSIPLTVPVQPASPRSPVKDIPQDSDEALPTRPVASSSPPANNRASKTQTQIHRSKRVSQLAQTLPLTSDIVFIPLAVTIQAPAPPNGPKTPSTSAPASRQATMAQVPVRRSKRAPQAAKRPQQSSSSHGSSSPPFKKTRTTYGLYNKGERNDQRLTRQKTSALRKELSEKNPPESMFIYPLEPYVDLTGYVNPYRHVEYKVLKKAVLTAVKRNRQLWKSPPKGHHNPAPWEEVGREVLRKTLKYVELKPLRAILENTKHTLREKIKKMVSEGVTPEEMDQQFEDWPGYAECKFLRETLQNHEAKKRREKELKDQQNQGHKTEEKKKKKKKPKRK